MCSEYVCVIATISPGLDFGGCGPIHEYEPDRRQKLLRDEKRKHNWKGKRNRKKKKKSKTKRERCLSIYY